LGSAYRRKNLKYATAYNAIAILLDHNNRIIINNTLL